MITGVSPAHFTCTGMGATMSVLPYSMRAVMSQTSPPSLVTPLMVYFSSFSGLSLPSLIEHQRPVKVALVRVALNVASNSSWLGWALAGRGGAAAAFG